MRFLEKFKTEYKPLLDCRVNGAKRGLIEGLYKRGEGFQLMFDLMLSHKQSKFEIVETGTMRNPGAWKDGQSGMLFTEFVEEYGGRSRSVDIDAIAVQISESAGGLRHPVEELAKAVKEINPNIMIIADGITAVGVERIDVTDIDCLIAGSQKALMLPPGLSILGLSNSGIEKIGAGKGLQIFPYVFRITI